MFVSGSNPLPRGWCDSGSPTTLTDIAGQLANWLKSYRTSGRRVSSACSKSGVRLARRSAVDGVLPVRSTSPEGLVRFVIPGRVPRVWLLIGRHDVLKERTEIQINEIFMPAFIEVRTVASYGRGLGLFELR